MMRFGKLIVFAIFIGSKLTSCSTVFTTEQAVFLPRTEGHVALWRQPGACFWSAPPCFGKYACLEFIPSYKNNPLVRHLFKEILKVADANWGNYVRQLEIIKSSAELDFQAISDLYRLLHEKVSEANDWATVR